jgi:hypothetical protein
VLSEGDFILYEALRYESKDWDLMILFHRLKKQLFHSKF